MGYQTVFLRPTVIVSVLLVLLVVVIGAGANLIAPHDTNHMDLENRNLPPFWVGPTTVPKQVVQRPETGRRDLEIPLHEAREIDPNAALGDYVEVVIRKGGSTENLLGTDPLGRDVLSHIVASFRIYPYIGVLGTFLGILAAWLLVVAHSIRGASITQNMPRPLLGVPFYALAILTYVIGVFLSISIAASVGVSLEVTIVCAGVFSSLLPMALVYGSVREDAASSGPVRLAVRRGIALSPIGFSLALLMGLLLESSISFLGVGVPPLTPSLGGMIADARAHFTLAMWIPLGILLVAVWAFSAIAIPVGRILSPPAGPALPGQIGAPAGFWIRAAAEMIDHFAMLTVLFVIGVLQSASAIMAIALLPAMVWIFVASPGKRALGLHVLRPDGSRVGLGRKFCRSPLAWIFSAVLVNLMIAFRKDKRGLHDLICDTVVVHRYGSGGIPSPCRPG